MRLDRVLADHEVGGDLGVGHSARDEPQHLRLARRELAERCRRSARRPPRELLDQPPRDRGREERAAVGHDPDRRDEALLGCVLEQETAGAGTQRVVDDLVEVERRQHEHARARLADDDLPRRLDPVHHRHAHVHEHDIRCELECERDRLAAIGRLTDDLEPGHRGEDHPEAGSHELLVVCDEDADHRSLAYGSAARTAKPPSSRGPASSSPPTMAARSRRPTSPLPVPLPFADPRPSSTISSSTASAA